MTDYRRLARLYARRAGLDENIFERQIGQESGFNPNAVSPAGALGIAQIMPATAKGWGVDPRNPRAALRAAAENMAKYVKQYGSYRNALIAYNAGPGAVGSKSLPAETQNYIAKILGGRNPGADTLNASNVSRIASGGAQDDPRIAKIQQLRDVFASMNDALAQPTPLSLLDPGLGPTQKDFQANYDLIAKLGDRGDERRPTTRRVQNVPNVQSPKGGFHVGVFEDSKVPAWAVPALKWARQHGWTGHITSGVRTREEQAYLYSHPQGYPVARPGESNHEIENGGAFDVDPGSAAQLWKILQRYPGRKPIWAPSVGLDDKVHFSINGH